MIKRLLSEYREEFEDSPLTGAIIAVLLLFGGSFLVGLFIFGVWALRPISFLVTAAIIFTWYTIWQWIKKGGHR